MALSLTEKIQREGSVVLQGWPKMPSTDDSPLYAALRALQQQQIPASVIPEEFIPEGLAPEELLITKEEYQGRARAIIDPIIDQYRQDKPTKSVLSSILL